MELFSCNNTRWRQQTQESSIRIHNLPDPVSIPPACCFSTIHPIYHIYTSRTYPSRLCRPGKANNPWKTRTVISSNLFFFSPFPAVDHFPIKWVDPPDPSKYPTNHNPQLTHSVSGFLPGVAQFGPTRIPGPPGLVSLGNHRLDGWFRWILAHPVPRDRHPHRAVSFGAT